jgi:putative phosphoesterase
MRWVAELERLDADVLLVGHSHVPFIRRIGGKVIVNPGSVGQPRSGDARASYAVWDDGLGVGASRGSTSRKGKEWPHSTNV